MIHVGNDIVDLASPFVIGRGRDEKLIKRVLTPEEGASVQASARPDIRLQMYWAARETAFKVISKSTPGLSGAPRKYRVFLEASESGADRKDRFGHESKDHADIPAKTLLRGYVTTPAAVVHIFVYQNENFVHCLGTNFRNALPEVIFGVERTDPADSGIAPDFCCASGFESRLVRQSARNRLAGMRSINADRIRFTKQPAAQVGTAIPEVLINDKKTDLDISFSHDGRFVAYAILANSEPGQKIRALKI